MKAQRCWQASTFEPWKRTSCAQKGIHVGQSTTVEQPDLARSHNQRTENAMPYYLVQRLESKTEPGRHATGFDRYFSLDYMGSSEFEWGAIPNALEQVRKKPVAVYPADITVGGRTRTVYFVCHKDTADDAVVWMNEWAAGVSGRGGFWGKEWSEFPERFADTPDRFRRTNAWWALKENVAWALSDDIANSLVLAFNDKPQS